MGTILPFKGNISDIPDKWALCNGFNGTPNLTGRFLEGVTSSPGSMKSAGLPNIIGSISYDWNESKTKYEGSLSTSYQSGARKVAGNGGSGVFGVHASYINFDASKTNITCAAIYRNDVTTVQPASYTVLYIMKIKA